MNRKFLLILVLSCFALAGTAQKITYSEPDRDDGRGISFEIIGKFGNNFIIYKNLRDNHYLSLYDNNMKAGEKQKLGFLPDKIINADFLVYPDFFYMFYQYQRRNVVYCMAAKFDGFGKKIGEPIQMDTTEIGFFASNKMYSVVYSEDKQKIIALKVNTKSEKRHIVTASLFDKSLTKISKTRTIVPMLDDRDFLTEFNIDNDGNLAFIKAVGTNQNDNIGKLSLATKTPMEEVINFYDLPIDKMYLDDVKLKVDNINKRYLVTSYYSKQRRGNIEGLYCMLWDKKGSKMLTATATVFSDSMRMEARGENSTKMAFNDYYLRNIVLRKDGGYVVTSEAAYSSVRGGVNNSRWDNAFSPYYGSTDYYSYNNYGSSYPWGRNGYYNNQTTRYYADNVGVMSFDSIGKMEWVNFIPKSQYDDNTDNLLGYCVYTGGGELHFLYNKLERRTQLLVDNTIDADGNVVRSPTLKNLDKGYEFMPRHGKQVSSRQIIMPCEYRNYICFAKIEF